MKQAKSATAAAAAPLDRSRPPSTADGSSWRCQTRCDHGEEATAPAVHGNEQSRWVRGLQCSDPLCAYTAARQLARLLRDRASGPDESVVCALDRVLAQLLMPHQQQQQQQSHWDHSVALCPRGMGALQLLSQLSRLHVRSSSAIELEHHSHAAGGDVTSGVATFMQAALPHLSAVSAACIESDDVLVQGELLSFLVDLGQIVLDHDVPSEQRAWGRALLDCLEQRLERLLLLPSDLDETLNLLLVVRVQLGFQQQPQEATEECSGAKAHRTHRMVLERSIAQLRALDVRAAAGAAHEDDADEREEQERTLWLLVAASLRACVSSLPRDPSARTQRLSGLSGVWAALHGAMRLEVGDAAAGGGGGGAAFRARLLALLSEEDDKLVDTLLHLAHVHAAMGDMGVLDKQQRPAEESAAASSSSAATGPAPLPHASPSASAAVLSALDPYALLHDFLFLLSFDHSPLLDWLVGNETACLAYLHVVLRRIASGSGEFKSFAEACERAGVGSGSGSGTGSASSCQAAPEHSDADSEQEHERESGLDAAMSCLIRLHLALKRLVDKSLFPYPIGPLLRSLQQIEAEYERAAGDFETGGDDNSDGDGNGEGDGDSDVDA